MAALGTSGARIGLMTSVREVNYADGLDDYRYLRLLDGAIRVGQRTSALT